MDQHHRIYGHRKPSGRKCPRQARQTRKHIRRTEGEAAHAGGRVNWRHGRPGPHAGVRGWTVAGCRAGVDSGGQNQSAHRTATGRYRDAREKHDVLFSADDVDCAERDFDTDAVGGEPDAAVRKKQLERSQTSCMREGWRTPSGVQHEGAAGESALAPEVKAFLTSAALEAAEKSACF